MLLNEIFSKFMGSLILIFFQAGNVLSQLLEIWLDKVSKIITCRNLKCFHLTFFGG